MVDIEAVRGCTFSALKTTVGKIYFLGFAHGNLATNPVAADYSSFEELFLSLDPPMMLQPIMELQMTQAKIWTS